MNSIKKTRLDYSDIPVCHQLLGGRLVVGFTSFDQHLRAHVHSAHVTKDLSLPTI